MGKNRKVIIIGRMNVGKSTLFNRLSDNVKSMTLDYQGITRDFIVDTISWNGRCFDLIDTGGISLRKTQDKILEKVRQKALDLVQESDLVLFVCDGTVGITPEDREISKLLHKLNKNVVLIVNKIDVKSVADSIHEFRQLGFATILPVSAEHAKGIADVLDYICQHIPESVNIIQEKVGCSVVLLGKPNVGKSSLMNLLLKKERTIVSEIAGTTREAVSDKVSFYSEDILLTDTPGIRKKHSVTENLESMMVKTSFRALQNADLVLLLIDASEGLIADQELKLAFYAFTQKYKALAILYNKQDLTNEDSKVHLETSLSEYKFMLKKVPQLNISCKTDKNIGKVLPLVQEIWKRLNQRFSEEELTILFKNALDNKPLMHKTIPLMVYAAKQISTNPITILLIVNESVWFGPSQLLFFENLMRAKFDLLGVAIKFQIKKRR